MVDECHLSYDQKHKATLTYLNEVRFGPPYFKLKLDNKLLLTRIFGLHLRWAVDSNYFAIEEWLSTDYNKGPLTNLVLFDVDNNLEYTVCTVEHGFVMPSLIENNILKYSKVYHYKSLTEEHEFSINDITTWKRY